MATQVVEFESASGLTLNVKATLAGTPGTVYTATGVVEIRSGLYNASFSDLGAGLYYFETYESTTYLGRGIVNLLDASGTYREAVEVIRQSTLGGTAGGSGSSSSLYYYGTVDDGDLYFAQRLRSDKWENATDPDKEKALFQATGLIDKLAYRGNKTVSTQPLQFPRGGDTSPPGVIVQATYLVAIKLLGNFDADKELAQMSQTRSRFGPSVEIEKLPVPSVHIMAGIPSIEAWRLLYPYLLDVSSVKLIKV